MKDHQISHLGTPTVGQAADAAVKPHRILVVDDDDSIRRLDTAVLTRAGYDVDAAEDGAVAWRTLNAESYDLLITDNNMPALTGIELLQKMRAARMCLPVIVASGTFLPPATAVRPWLQPQATLLKPYSIEQLLDTVNKVLRNADHTAGNGAGVAGQQLKDKEAAPAVVPQPGPPLAAHRILVVDEDRDLCRLYVETLAGLDCRVDVVADGAAAWAALRANHYDLLIAEHELPTLTGLELVRKLGAARLAVPVVLAAARLPGYELARNPALQLAATLAKPFAVEALLDTVKQVLSAAVRPGAQTDAPPNSQSQPSTVGLKL